jgi:hypothetical protein
LKSKVSLVLQIRFNGPGTDENSAALKNTNSWEHAGRCGIPLDPLLPSGPCDI